jgi:hypothetical protein
VWCWGWCCSACGAEVKFLELSESVLRLGACPCSFGDVFDVPVGLV